jgi:glyoxylase-like metal-dependent hydrolase (beta-lactamase superfamily II)
VHVLQGHGRVILVETGPPSYIPLLSGALEELGLAVEDVTDVLVTHAHWDHLSNIMMFAHAQVWIGAQELAWASALRPDAPFISSLHIAELESRGSTVSRVGDGDVILPGITVLAAPGHTPGHVAYSVETDSHGLVFAGDAVKNLHELATMDVDSTLDIDASRASITRLREHLRATEAILVPGHDVPLKLSGDTATRVKPQQANISFFNTALGDEEDRTVTDG